MTRVSSILFWFCLIIVASLGLYRTSDRVAELNRQLRDINVAIDGEKESIHVLNAEWVYLSNPARIAALGKKHLTLRPTAPQQVATMAALSDLLPSHTESAVMVAVDGTPAANDKTTSATRALVTTVSARRSEESPVTVAHIDTGHLRDRMVLVQHTASAAPLPGDSIGNLLNRLDAGR